MSQDGLDNIQVSASTGMVLNIANSSIISARDAIKNRGSLLSSSDELLGENQLELDRVNSSLSSLRLRLRQALEAAAMVGNVK